ncbi:MAG TPA: glycosyltransferase, partial [Caulobacteraceae bacterium]|nr:glycosyltransferase [Caulobacteraceae bacterium]
VWVESPAMPFDPNYHMFVTGQEVWEVLDREAPDVVEGSSPWRGGWLAGHWAGPAVKSLVFHQDFIAGYPYTLLGGVLSRPAIDSLFAPYWGYVRKLSACFDVTVAGGDWLAERLKGFDIHNPVSVPFGIETGLFSPEKRDAALRRDLLEACGAPPDGKLLLAVGRLHPEKRHRTIIEGFARARAARPDLGLVIIGDGPLRANVEAWAARAGKVHVAGPIADRAHLARCLASGDILVHGSGAETYGLVVAEAIASGLAVVAPDTGGAADLARRGLSRIYATGDAESCGRAILALLRAVEAPGRRPPANPPGSAESHFAALFKLYQRLIDARDAASTPEGARQAKRTASA